MATAGQSWVVVLAAGEGTRLRSLTRSSDGRHVPKQYCSFLSDRSLLEVTIARAERLVPRERVLVVVAEQHRGLWAAQLAELPPENVVVQPRNRGTALGLLLGVLATRTRDPEAMLSVLPSDHHVGDEREMLLALRRARVAAGLHPRSLVLLGIEPDSPDTSYGWIAPEAERDGAVARIAAFEEKPELRRAAQLMAEGALWSSFIMAGRLDAWVAIFERALPQCLRSFEDVFETPAGPAFRERLDRLYEEATEQDFSRHVLQNSIPSLLSLRVTAAGWSDLGTPERLRRCLGSSRSQPARPARESLVTNGAHLALEAALVATANS